MSPADLDPQIASIGAALIVAIGFLIVADQRPKRRVQSVPVDEEGES